MSFAIGVGFCAILFMLNSPWWLIGLVIFIFAFNCNEHQEIKNKLKDIAYEIENLK